MSRIVPHPLISAAIVLLWLALQGTSAGDIVLAVLLALLAPALFRPVLPARGRMRRPIAALKLAGRVLVDIIASNIEVARRILGRESAIHPAFVRYPLELESEWGIAVLSGIITMTPGTVTADIIEDGRALLIHALHVDDPSAITASIRERYELALLEIYPCT